MKILYDHQCFDMEKYGGVSRYFCELMKSKSYDHALSLKHNSNGMLVDYGFREEAGKPWNKEWMEENKNYTIELLKKGDFDVFHPTFYDDYFLEYLGDKPFVLTIHDMVSELYRWHDDKIEKRKILVNKAAKIIAISENTKNDILKIYGPHLSDKIEVIYHGTTSMHKDNHKILDYPYFLFVGTRDLYKAFIPMIIGVSQYLKGSSIKIICTSHKFTKLEEDLFVELGIEDNLIHKSELDVDLEDLYAGAKALIFPSEYEGFGLPILEAASVGCPVLCSNASCFPEIVNLVGGHLFNNYIELINLMEEALNSNALKKRASMMIKPSVSRFNWGKTIDKHKILYESCI